MNKNKLQKKKKRCAEHKNCSTTKYVSAWTRLYAVENRNANIIGGKWLENEEDFRLKDSLWSVFPYRTVSSIGHPCTFRKHLGSNVVRG
jgi:hypothetical protein